MMPRRVEKRSLDVAILSYNPLTVLVFRGVTSCLWFILPMISGWCQPLHVYYPSAGMSHSRVGLHQRPNYERYPHAKHVP